MLPAANVRALTTPALVREQTRWIATIGFSAVGLMIAFSASHCISSERRRQRNGASKAENERRQHHKHGTPSRRKGRVRSAASLGGPDPGATRRLCPGRIARALPVLSSRKSSKA
jgi:hypothetical protein